jgi:hypothetical protein
VIKQLVSHDPERNGTHGRTENARGAANQDLGRHHGPEGRQLRNQQRPHRQCDDPRGNQRAFESEVIDQRARRGLGQDSGDPTDGESDSHTLLVPPISREVDGEEWSDSRLDVGEKEIQPVQTTERSGGRRFGIPVLRCLQVPSATFPLAPAIFRLARH